MLAKRISRDHRISSSSRHKPQDSCSGYQAWEEEFLSYSLRNPELEPAAQGCSGNCWDELCHCPKAPEHPWLIPEGAGEGLNQQLPIFQSQKSPLAAAAEMLKTQAKMPIWIIFPRALQQSPDGIQGLDAPLQVLMFRTVACWCDTFKPWMLFNTLTASHTLSIVRYSEMRHEKLQIINRK